MLIYIESTLISHTCTYAVYATFIITMKAFHPFEWDYKTLSNTQNLNSKMHVSIHMIQLIRKLTVIMVIINTPSAYWI